MGILEDLGFLESIFVVWGGGGVGLCGSGRPVGVFENIYVVKPRSTFSQHDSMNTYLAIDYD